MGILRLVLAFSVIASHVGPILGLNFLGGSLAVQSFFIISGFYMSVVLNEKYIGEKKAFKLFVGNRLLKLFPAYYFVLLLTILTSIIIYNLSDYQSYPVFDNYISANPNVPSLIYLLLTHVLILGQDMVMFMGVDIDSGSLFFTSNFWNTSPPLYSFLFVPQAWSLGLELLFYFVAPYILRRKFKIILYIIAGSVLLRYFLFYNLGLQNDPWTYRFFPTELAFFLLGSISYQLYKFVRQIAIPAYASWLVFSTIMSLIIVYSFLHGMPSAIFQFSWLDILFFTFFVISIPLLFKYFKGKRYDNMIGDLSYPVYLTHLLVARICNYSGVRSLQSGFAIAVISVILSCIINFLIAKPIKKRKEKRLRMYSKGAEERKLQHV
jgi:peptidoglycan/LPS O-acetylase OafA/YrhL